MIEFITKYVTLNAGDCIFTGTPGSTQDMATGAVCEIDISGIGVLRNNGQAGRAGTLPSTRLQSSWTRRQAK